MLYMASFADNFSRKSKTADIGTMTVKYRGALHKIPFLANETAVYLMLESVAPSMREKVLGMFLKYSVYVSCDMPVDVLTSCGFAPHLGASPVFDRVAVPAGTKLWRRGPKL